MEKHSPASPAPVGNMIDLSHANLFQGRWDSNSPTYPILQELGAGPVHRYSGNIIVCNS